MSLLLVTPVIAPLLAAIVGLFFLKHRNVQRSIGIAGPVAILASGLALLVIVNSEGIKVTTLAGGRHRSASFSWLTFSVPSCS